MQSRFHQLLLKSKTKHFSQGSIIADSHEPAQGLMVITSGFVNVELPIDSEDADEESQTDGGRTVLYVFTRGCACNVLPVVILLVQKAWNETP
jgi:hypothetical protein